MKIASIPVQHNHKNSTFSEKMKLLRSYSNDQIKTAKHSINTQGFFKGHHRTILKARIRIFTSYIPGIRSLYISVKKHDIDSRKRLHGNKVQVFGDANS